jgi:hypothetical protein
MITLLSQPQDFMPVNNPIVWTWESDEVTQPNFKYVVDLFINGSLHSTHDVFIGEFDAKEALEAVVKSALTFNGTVTEVFTDSIVKYRIRIKEFYSGSIQDDVWTDLKVGINGALRPPEWKDYTPELYVLQNDGLAVQRQFLTRFPSNQKRFIGINETAHLGVNIRKAINEIVFVTVWLYGADGSLIVSSPLNLTSFESILINVSPKVIIANSTITLANFESAAYYEVRATLFSVAFPFILTPVGRTEDLRFYIDRDCERYPWIRLHWLNKLGGFDEFSFKLDTVHESDVTIFDKGYVHYTKSAIDRLILNSDWINETTQNWLVRELLESPLVYLEQLKVAEDIDCSCVRIVAVEGGNTVYYRPILQEDGSYLFGGFQLACDGGEWVVSNIVSETCDCVTVTITEGESVTVVTLNADGVDETGRSYYTATVDGVTYQLGWFETRWALIATEDEESVILGELFENGLCPFGNWRVSLEDVDSIVSEDCGESPGGDGCDCISVTYTLVGEEPVTVEPTMLGTRNGRNLYFFIIRIFTDDDAYDLAFEIYWDNNNWVLFEIQLEPEPPFLNAILSEDTPCPFGTFTIEEESIFESFSVAPSVCPPTPTTYATLNEDCACPIGEYTTTEESPFSSFRVIPCDDPDYLIEYERIKVIDTTYQLKTRKRNGLFAQQVTAQRAYEYRSQLS